MRRKVKFLTVVWGEAYIARFTDLALPSFIAPGNLPALAEATDLEVVIMTRRSDIDFFDQHSTFRMLQAICPVRFVEIDDLITSSAYGVTLTLAYVRPIVACGQEMLNTHFVFMNADFVLADGSLRSLSKHILDDRSIVLGPSFRAIAEDVEPQLKTELGKSTSGVLSIPPRSLAKISLAHPHATTVAKTLNQDLCHSTHPNQFFWQVDEQTLLGRYYLIFMLCLKPERILKTIDSYCDYALIPELCPSADEVAMGDSDDFFMLELQERGQEMHMLRLGRQPENETVASLQHWTTAEHRRAAHHDIVFHSGDLPAGLTATKAQAKTFIDHIGKKLGRPIRHTEHHYWVRGVEAWKNYRKNQNLSSSPPELSADGNRSKNWGLLNTFQYFIRKQSWLLAYSIRGAVLGQTEQPTRLNPDWLDNRLLRDTLDTLSVPPDQHTLIVRDSLGLLDYLVKPGNFVEFAHVEKMLQPHSNLDPGNQGGYRHILIYLAPSDWGQVREVTERCLSMLRKDGECHVLLHSRGGEMYGENIYAELLLLLETIGGTAKYLIRCAFVGGLLKRFNRGLFSQLGKSYTTLGTPSLFWILPLSAIALPLSLATNLYLATRLPSRYYTSNCSGIAIHISPLLEKSAPADH